MIRRSTVAAIVLACSAGIQPAGAERLVTSISRHQVLVNSNFTGTSIVLFGTVEPDNATQRRRTSGYDIVVSVTGPKQTMVVRRKQRLLGIWTNLASRTFVEVPSYLAMMSTRPTSQFISSEAAEKNHIGIDNTVLPEQIGPDIGDAPDDPFRANFVRVKREHHLYLEISNGVTLLTPTVFRAEIPLPAQASFGNYDVDIKAFADGAVVAHANSAFEIVKVGFEQFVANAARDYGVLYGLATAMMALMTGWFASVVFRRD